MPLQCLQQVNLMLDLFINTYKTILLEREQTTVMERGKKL